MSLIYLVANEAQISQRGDELVKLGHHLTNTDWEMEDKGLSLVTEHNRAETQFVDELAADTVILISDPEEPTLGNIEYGIALAKRKQIYVVGPHDPAQILFSLGSECYEDWEACKRVISARSETAHAVV